jgi:putative DNA primase/helicase
MNAMETAQDHQPPAEVKVPLGIEEIRAAARAKIAQEEVAFNKPKFTLMELLEFARSGEAGDAELFIRLFQGKLVKDHASGTWYVWAEHSWKMDELDNTLARVGDLIPLYADAARACAEQEVKYLRESNKDAAEGAKSTREIFTKKISCLQRRRHRQDVLILAAAGEGSLGITGREWDADPYLLVFKNGVVDLRTRVFRPGRPMDFIKTVAPVEWKGFDAPAPRWEKFLSEIFDGDLEIASFLKRLLGYSIAGLSVEHSLPILWGPGGRNGKGCLIETLNFVLGDLAGPAPSELLLEQKNPRSSAAPSPDIMLLRGKRLAWANETNDGRRLNSGKIKWLCGGDTLSGRNPFDKRQVSFEPTHTLFLLTNFRPHVDPGDAALWDRLHLIEFRLSFVDAPNEPHQRPRDKYLRRKLKQEAPGIVAWLVDGFREWQDKGLRPPPQVVNATCQYRKGEDLIEQFLEECCVISKDAFCRGGKIFSAYQKWCDERGVKSRRKKFYEKVSYRFDSFKSDSGKIYQGIGLTQSDGMTQNP